MQPSKSIDKGLIVLLTMTLTTTGCFRGLFSEAPRYLATEYVVDKPRIVAIRTTPTEMVSGEPAKFDALLLAPKESTIEGWSASVCGLNPDIDTQTIIWDLLCFEKDESVTQLFSTSSLPHSFATPTFTLSDECDRWGSRDYIDTGYIEDTGWNETLRSSCAHYLPIMFEATVDGSPVYAAGFTYWYDEFPTDLAREASYSDAGIELSILTEAQAGDEVPLKVTIGKDATGATFQWYIDAGTLKETGITRAHSYVAPTDDFVIPRTTSTNRLIIPPDYEGPLRVWVVIHEPWGDDFDMTWVEGQLEVTR